MDFISVCGGGGGGDIVHLTREYIDPNSGCQNWLSEWNIVDLTKKKTYLLNQ